MIGGLVTVLLIVVVGGRAVDELRRKEGESVLGRLPATEARAYYEILRRRMRRIAIMRAVALLSLLWIFFVYRQQLVRRQLAPHPIKTASSTTSVDHSVAASSSP